MLVILGLKRWPMNNVDSRVVRIKISRYEDVGGLLLGEAREELGV